jgi:hypothetical protein
VNGDRDDDEGDARGLDPGRDLGEHDPDHGGGRG